MTLGNRKTDEVIVDEKQKERLGDSWLTVREGEVDGM